MIPYFQATAIHLTDSIALQPFGLLVGTGVLLGAWLAKRRAREAGVSEDEIRSAIFSAVIPGFLMAHWVTLFFYHFEWLDTKGPLIIFKFWEGLSSFGGFLGAFLGLLVYFGRKRKSWLLEAEILLQALLLGWIFGRLGCTIVHDHPGNHTDFFLAVNYPDGPRHDLGLYEFLYTLLVLFPLSLWIHARRFVTGTTIAATVILYAPFRFLCDFLRVRDSVGADRRYLGLTPAQYGCIAVFIGGLYLLNWLWRASKPKLKSP
jgi:phosphatidylglycerol:prolipoprotein diacylglycerol transferase